MPTVTQAMVEEVERLFDEHQKTPQGADTVAIIGQVAHANGVAFGDLRDACQSLWVGQAFA